ncbi:MAG: chorismate mutase [Gemmatimonadaceae bacterium]|jgi:chorismate mutase|nr:chorismate mutase [Gemmatimonadaceae bacterium]
MPMRAVRGAVSADADTPAAIAHAVTTLLDALLERNGLALADVASAIFTVTPDVTSLRPPTAARAAGWGAVPMLAVAEAPTVEQDPPHCIRVLLHVHREGDGLLPVYLGAARALRPDLG